MNKRGITPLTTTVVISLLVVAVVIIVTLWGKGVQKDLQSKQGGIALAELSCTGVDFDLVSVTTDSVTVQNKGLDLEGVLVIVEGNGDVQSRLFTQPIPRGESRSFPFTGIPGVGNVEDVAIVGTVGAGVQRPCLDQKKEIEL